VLQQQRIVSDQILAVGREKAILIEFSSSFFFCALFLAVGFFFFGNSFYVFGNERGA
jgi:hypothetical protein